MTTKRDVLILQLIRYLLEGEDTTLSTDKIVSSLTSATTHQNKGNIGLTNDINNQISHIQQDISKKFQHLSNNIESLRKEVKSITRNKPQSKSSNNGSASENPELYQAIIDDALESSEYYLQKLINGAFLASGGFKNLYLWSKLLDNDNICLVLMQAKTPKISGGILNALGSQILGEISNNIKNPSEVLRLVNRKVFDFHNRHKNVDKKISACSCFINKRKAKILFSGANINLYNINDDGVEVISGNKEFVGIPSNQFKADEISIQRGQTLYFYSGEQAQKLEEVWKSMQNKTGQVKKAKLQEWLSSKKQKDAVLGISF